MTTFPYSRQSTHRSFSLSICRVKRVYLFPHQIIHPYLPIRLKNPCWNWDYWLQKSVVVGNFKFITFYRYNVRGEYMNTYQLWIYTRTVQASTKVSALMVKNWLCNPPITEKQLILYSCWKQVSYILMASCFYDVTHDLTQQNKPHSKTSWTIQTDFKGYRLKTKMEG